MPFGRIARGLRSDGASVNVRDRGVAVPQAGADVADFYDRLASAYHLVYENWEASVDAQGAALDALIREFGGVPGDEVLDVACGIGTQTLGLAERGYALTASDLSAGAVARARREAQRRGLVIDFSVADMRRACEHHASGFDALICVDNALPHLLTDGDILLALRQFHACLRPGGLCVLSVRDYATMERGGTRFRPHGVRRNGMARHAVFQVWEWREPLYDLNLYVVRDALGQACRTDVFRSTCYAIGIDRLMALLTQAGFGHLERRDDVLFQPVIVGIRPAGREVP